MQQRQLRLGDIIDDYCPRERRITNHAVVAMVGDDVKQVRCTTCDAEHPYKRAQVPVTRRKKEPVSSAFRAVLSSVQQEAAGAAVVARVAEPAIDPAAETVAGEPDAVGHPPAGVAASAAAVVTGPPVAALPHRMPIAPVVTAPAVVADKAPLTGAQDDEVPEEGRVHRRLIRAQLPRLEGKEPTPRPIPQFTVHDQRAAAAFRGRGGPRSAGGGRGPFTRDAGARSVGFSPRPPKPHDPDRRARHGGRPHKPGKKHPK